MHPGVRRFVGKVVPFREGEGTTALLMFAYSLLAMTAYNVIKPATRSEAIAALGADNIPYLQLAAVLLIGLIMQAYGKVSSAFPRRWVVPLTQASEAGLLVVFWLLFLTGSPWVPVAFYVLGMTMGVLLISQFWTLANDIYDPRQARRLFGFIGGGASLGGIAGSRVAMLAEFVGTNNLLLISAALLTGCAVVVSMVISDHDRSVVGPVEERVAGGEGLRLLRNSRHLQIIALVIGAAALGASLIDQQLNMFAESGRGNSTDTMTAFLSQVTYYASVAGLVIQIGLTTRIHRTFGLGVALLLLPIALGGSAALILSTGAVWAVTGARVADASLRYTVDKTTREILFLPLPSAIKHRIKPFLDVTVDRFAKALGAILLLVLIKPWGFELDWWQLSWASIAVTGVWIAIAVVARREYLKSFRRSLEDRCIATASVRLDVADDATVEALVEELTSPDEEAVLYAVELLEGLDKRNLITPLLLNHKSARVRARVLAGLDMTHPSVRGRWAAHVEDMLGDEDPAVRAAAVQALASLGMATRTTTMRRYLDDDEPRVAATAAAVLAGSTDPHERALADAVFTRLTSDPRPVAARARREAASALARVRDADIAHLLAVLARDGDVTVVREAVTAMRNSASRDPMFVPVLLSLLGSRDVKRDARRTLLAYGPDLVPLLDYILNDDHEPLWVRRHVPATLAGVGTQAAMDVLVQALDDRDGFVRFKALEAIGYLHRQNPALRFDRAPIEHRLTVETTRYHVNFALRHDLTRGATSSADALLMRALDDRLQRTTDRVFRLLALLYPWRDVAAARVALERGDSRRRARALEYVDGLLSVSLRRRVLPILDVTSKEEAAHHAYALLRTRPRDEEDALAQLVHEEDPVIAAAAMMYATDRQLVALRSDIDYVAAHRTDVDDHARQVAAWVTTGRAETDWAGSNGDDLPVIAVADRLRRIPLFAFVSVDELCRVAARGVQRVYGQGEILIGRHEAADRACFLLEGAVTIDTDQGPPEQRRAPAALDIDAALEGGLARRTIRAAGPLLSFEVPAQELLTTLAESESLVRGVFRMLLSPPEDGRWQQLTLVAEGGQQSIRGLGTAIDRVLLLRQHPLFRRARVDDVLGLATIVRELTIAAGSIVADEPGEPSLYHVVTGKLQVDTSAGGTVSAEPGRTIGIVDVLTGAGTAVRAVAEEDTRLLQIRGYELFEWLTDHVDLLQSLLSAVFAASRADVGQSNVDPPEEDDAAGGRVRVEPATSRSRS